MSPRIWKALPMAVLLNMASIVEAVPHSTNYQLVTDGVISGGQTCNANQARTIASAIGEPIANDVATASFKLSEGHFVTQRQLLFLLPHQAPTLNPVTTPTAVATPVISGTKAPDTSLWLNGVQVVPLNAETIWSSVVGLAEGINVLNIVTKDLFGKASATITTAILLDTSPPTIPVVTDDGISTSVFSQLHATWTSSDPGSGLAAFEYRIGTTSTGSEVMPATGIGLATEVTKTGLTLIQGQRYYIAVRAKNQASLWSDWGVSDGIYANASAPTMSLLTPADGSKRYAGDPTTLSVTAADADGDPLEYQFSRDGVVKQAWGSLTTHDWVTTAADIGIHTIKAEVRDGHGGAAQREQQIYILRKPITPF